MSRHSSFVNSITFPMTLFSKSVCLIGKYLISGHFHKLCNGCVWKLDGDELSSDFLLLFCVLIVYLVVLAVVIN